MPTNAQYLFLVVLIFAVCLSGNEVYAFGAGNIPSFAYMAGRAFRHGDIEDTLSELAKKGAGGFALSSLMGKSKFSGLDIKRVYFGNWLRDYSQAVDITGLKKLPLQTIINLCMALSFVSNGYATEEFEVTAERLGVYLPTEHIDNPKGYGDGEDARKYDPRLRGPVKPMELEVDPRTGMKNYIANESGGWDTSKALVRRTFEMCIHLGRRHRHTNQKQDLYEAYRLLGQGLHTLEDFSAHSNFCELALVNMGHTDVFVHVGDHVRLQAPNGKYVAPLVTGSFGSSDFIFSLLGEATDRISESCVTDLNKELDNASNRSRGAPGSSGNPGDALRELLFKIPGNGGGDMSREMDGIERIRAGPSQGGKKPEDMTPQELHAILWQVLSFRDSVVKNVSNAIETIPGLRFLMDKLLGSMSVFIFTTLEPFLKPILKTATAALSTASAEVIDTHDQYEVFNDPRASDPTHSFLSKDHFNLILNEPAGHVAKVVLIHAVGLITKAWDDVSVNVYEVTEEILECLFHPDFHDSRSKVQREMLAYMHTWVQSLGNNQHNILHRLNKQAVRNHENIRRAGDGEIPKAEGSFAYNQDIQMQQNIQGYASSIPIAGQRKEMPSGPQIHDVHGGRRYSSAGSPLSPLPSDESAPFYSPPAGVPGASSGYARPPGPPPSFPHPPGGYAPPPGYPPGGYTPNYPSPPSFPDYSPIGGYAPPQGSPPFPGPAPYAAPPGPPPAFPSPPRQGYPPPGGYDQYAGRGW